TTGFVIEANSERLSCALLSLTKPTSVRWSFLRQSVDRFATDSSGVLPGSVKPLGTVLHLETSLDLLVHILTIEAIVKHCIQVSLRVFLGMDREPSMVFFAQTLLFVQEQREREIRNEDRCLPIAWNRGMRRCEELLFCCLFVRRSQHHIANRYAE